MNYIAMIVAGIVLVFAAYRGYRAGIIRMILYVAALVITIVLTGFLLKPVSHLVKENTSLYTNINQSVAQVISEHNIADMESLKELPYPEALIGQIETPAAAIEDFEQFVANSLTDQIFNALIYVCLNIVLYLALRIVLGAFGIVARLPVIRELNHLAGFLLGLAEGLVFLWLICLLLQACGSEPWAQQVFVQINDNSLLSWIYNHNVVADFLAKLI